MSASASCHHPELSYSIETSFGDGGLDYVEITAARCDFCHKRWRFVGFDSIFDPSAPTANSNATRVLIPMVEITG